jgi:metallo-beta-lactamase class B
MVEDFVRTWAILRSLPCDIFLGAHGSYFDMDDKLARFKTGAKPNPFIDPKGYRDFIDGSEQNYLKQLTAEKQAAR